MESFKTRFEKLFLVSPGCWKWIGCFVNSGYGQLSIEGKMWTSHRASYALYIGEIPKGQHVLHKCDNRKCVNPDHLFLGTHLDNIADKTRKGRAARVFGEANGYSKFTADDVRKIREKSLSFKEAKDIFNISQSHFYRLRNKTRWPHI